MQPLPTPSAPAPADTIDLRLVGGLLRRSMVLIVACFVAVLGAVAAFTAKATPRYEAVASIRIDEPHSRRPELDVLRSYSVAREVATEMEVLRSRSLAASVVESLSLQVRVTAPRRVSRSEVLAGVRVTDFPATGTYTVRREADDRFSVQGPLGAVRENVTIGQPIEFPGLVLTLAPEAASHATFSLEVDDTEEVLERFMKATRVARPAREANIITVRHQDADPVLAADALNLLAARFIEGRQKARNTDVHSTVAFLNGQLDTLRAQLVAAEEGLRRFREQERIVDLRMEAGAGVSRLADLQAERSGLDAERVALAALIEEVDVAAADQAPGGAAAHRRLIAFPTLLRNQVAAELLRSVSLLENQRTELLKRRRVDDPDVQVLARQIGALDAQLRSLAGTYLQGLTNQVAALDATLARFDRELERIPAREVHYARLQRESSVLEGLYTLLQTRLREAQIAQAAEDQSVRILDPAAVPAEPDSPNVRLNLIAGAFLGLLLGITLALVREYRNTSIRNRRDVQVAAGVPVLGLIPHLSDGRRRLGAFGTARQPARPVLRLQSRAGVPREPDLIASRERGMAIEAYTSLQTNLRFARGGTGPRTLVVVSPLPGDGKTTTAMNLALSYAMNGARTLLIDADLRRGVINTILGHSRSPGLSDLITGAAQLSDALRRVQASDGAGLDFLPAGTPAQNPATLIGAEETSRLLSRLASEYDVVVLDSSPVNLVADAPLLSTHADGVIVVARARTTQSQALSFAMEQLRASGAEVIGVVLNDIDLQRDVSYDQAYRWQREGYQYAAAP